MAVHETAAEGRASGAPASAQTGRRFGSGAGVSAGAAAVAGVLLVTRNEAISTLGILTIVAGVLALLGTAAAVREWPFARGWTGPTSVMERMAGPMAWLAAVFAAVIVATNFLPEIVPAWDREEVFAVAIVVFALLAVFGFGPRMTLTWPVGLRFSSLTVLGSLVALALVSTYLVFLVLMRADAASAGDVAWSRLVELRATLEALAFAAAGALLGTVVQRQAVAGERRVMEERVSDVQVERDVLLADLATRDRQIQSLRSAVESATRQLTPDAPAAAALGELAGVPARGSAVSVRRARQALLDALPVEG